VIAEDGAPDLASPRRPARMHGESRIGRGGALLAARAAKRVGQASPRTAVKTLVGELRASAGGTSLIPRDARHGIVAA